MHPDTTRTTGASPAARAIPAAELALTGSRTRRFEGEAHGSAVSYFAVDNDPGDTVALHRHPYVETWVVLEGHVRFTVGTAGLSGVAGDTVVAPAGEWHGFTNDGDGPLRMLCIHASPRIIQEWKEGAILSGMDLEQWWNGVMPQTRDWLTAHNGEALTPEVVADISSAGGLVAADSWWMGERGPDGMFLSDAATDWIEERANTEE
ncbi:cupin domain-containing protein [Arthrobacter sp. MDT2-16]